MGDIPQYLQPQHTTATPPTVQYTPPRISARTHPHHALSSQTNPSIYCKYNTCILESKTHLAKTFCADLEPAIFVSSASSLECSLIRSCPGSSTSTLIHVTLSNPTRLGKKFNLWQLVLLLMGVRLAIGEPPVGRIWYYTPAASTSGVSHLPHQAEAFTMATAS